MAEKLSELARHVRATDPDRFYAALFAPAGAREALFALLAFNYEVARTAETVSEPAIGLMRLEWWQSALEGIAIGRVPAHPAAEALAAAYRARPYSVPHLEALIEAREHDLSGEAMPDLSALVAYAGATGGGLHRAMAEVLGGDEKGLSAATAAGTAWALTGILRRLPVGGRSTDFLPEDVLHRHGVSRAELAAREAPAGLRAAIGEILSLALTQAQRARDAASGSALPAALVAALVPLYAARIARAQNPLVQQAEPSRGERILRLFLAARRARG